MSLNSLNKKSIEKGLGKATDSDKTFNEVHDEATRNNYQKTLNEADNAKKSNKLSFSLKPKNVAKKAFKHPTSFSITTAELEKFDQVARDNGFQNRSELLSAIIEAL